MIEPAPENIRTISRRRLLTAGITLAALYPALRPIGVAALGLPSRFAYVGSYSTPLDGGGNGKGIYLCEMNTNTGELRLLRLAAEAANASWLAIDPSGRYLYATNEVSTFAGHTGSVTSYAIDRSTGTLQLLNVVSSEGAGPAHLSVEATGKYVFVANYAGGNVAVLPVLPTGALGPATYVHQDLGALGPRAATNAPRGSFAISGHDAPHAHMIHADPSNHYVLQTDLGQDRIYVSTLDRVNGKMVPAKAPFASVPPGDGPRHFTFHPNGRWLYSLQEESSTIVLFHFDPATGSLQAKQTVSTLPAGFAGTSFSSEILLSPNSKFLYAVNRLHDTVAIFAVGEEGGLRTLGEVSTLGDYPRHIQMDPTGRYLYVCNQRSDAIAAFRVEKTGMLSFTGKYTGIGSPACLIFMP